MPEVHETKILARLLRDADLAHRLRSLGIDDESFTDKYLKGIAKVGLSHALRYSEPLTFDAFSMQVRSAGLDSASYLAAFTALLQTTCSRGELETALSELRRKRIIGNVESAISQTIDELKEKKLSVEEIAKNFRSRALEVGRNSGVSYASEGSLAETLDERLREMEEKQNNPGSFAGALSPWSTFNEVTNGIQDGELLIVVAEPGGGKSTWMINYSEAAYSTTDKNVLYFSHEMSRRSLEKRYDTRIAARLYPNDTVTYRAIRDGRMSARQLQIYRDVIEFQRSKRNQIYIIDDPTLDVDGIQDKIERMKGEFSVDLVIVDYLGILPGASGGWENVNRIAGQVYTLAREMNVPLVTAAQKNPEGGIGLSYLIKAHGSILIKMNQDEAMRMVREVEQEFIKNREGSTPRFNCSTDFDRILIEEVEREREVVDI